MSAPLSTEALELIQETAVKADGAVGKVQFATPPGEPKDVYYIIKSDGSCEFKETKSHPYSHYLRSVNDFVEFLGCEIDLHAVFISPQLAICLLGRNHRDRISLELGFSPQVKRIQEPLRLGQKELVRFLDYDMNDCWGQGCTELRKFAANVKFTSTATSSGTISAERSSLGRDIDEHVAGEVNCPTEISLSIPTGRAIGTQERISIRLHVSVSFRDQSFCIEAFPGELETIENKIVDQARQLMQSLTCPVIEGTP